MTALTVLANDLQAWKAERAERTAILTADENRVKIEYAAVENPDPKRAGYLAVVWVNGVSRTDMYYAQADESDALRNAIEGAEWYADRYSGDWNLTIGPRGSVS